MNISYTYPRPSTISTDMRLSRDELLNKNLEMSISPVLASPKETSLPYKKTFNSNNSTPESLTIPLSDPIDDIFHESKHIIDAYVISLPYMDDELKPDVIDPNAQVKVAPKLLPFEKHALQPLAERQFNNLQNAFNPHNGLKTPRKETETLLPQSSVKKPRSDIQQSTPVPNERQEFLNKDITTLKKLETEEADSSFDPLACHAGNIMRMAMDSTMLGSFCNHSFSSTFSNLADDSALERNALDDEYDPDRSILERLRAWPKSTLNKKRATKIDISAEELRSAINEPIR